MLEPNPDILPINWAVPPKPYELQITIAPLDEIGVPYEKRGLRLAVPADVKDWDTFAKGLAATVRNTVTFILKGEEK